MTDDQTDEQTDAGQAGKPTYHSTGGIPIGYGRTLLIDVRQIGGQDRGFCEKSVTFLLEQLAELRHYRFDPAAFDRLNARMEHPIGDGGYYITITTDIDDEHAEEARTSRSPHAETVDLAARTALTRHHQEVMLPELEHVGEDIITRLETHIPRPLEIDDETRTMIQNLIASFRDEPPND